MHIAEKYQQLARDAQASGDRVMFENYNQHAEHYLRIVAAAQPQQPPAQPAVRNEAEGSSEQASVNGAGAGQNVEKTAQAPADTAPVVDDNAPQPFIDNMPVIDQEGQVNGAAKASEGDNAEGEEKPRRRTRTPRARAPKRAAADAAAGDEASAESVSVAEAGEEQPKPRRRTTRPRRTKAAEETPAEAAAASE
jgi:hypothetical protein